MVQKYEEEDLFGPYALTEYGNNAYDFARQRIAPGAAYEMYCFQRQAQQFDGDLLLGPGVVNHVFGHAYTAGEGKPDMMAMEARGSRWCVSGLYECKSTDNRHVGGKLRKFSDLLRKLRVKPDFLPLLLDDIGDYALLGLSKIYVPEDNGVDVIFLSPRIPNHDFSTASKFRSVSFIAVPLPNQENSNPQK